MTSPTPSLPLSLSLPHPPSPPLTICLFKKDYFIVPIKHGHGIDIADKGQMETIATAEFFDSTTTTVQGFCLCLVYFSCNI